MARERPIQPRLVTIAAVALFLVIAVLPVALLMADSLQAEGRWTLEHYSGVLADARQIGLFAKSLLIAAAVTVTALLIGLPLAFLLARTDLPGNRIWRRLYFLPLCIPAYIHAVTWIYVLGTRGVLNRFLVDFFGLSSPPANIYGLPGTIMVLALAYYPFIVLLALGGLKTMDQRLEDAARLLHPQPRVFRKVTLPLVLPYLVSGAVFVFVFSLFNYGVPALLRVQTHPVEIFAQFSAFYDQRAAIARVLPLILIAVLLLGLQRRAMGSRSYVTLDTGAYRAEPIRLGHARYAALAFVAVLMLLSVAAPVIVLLCQIGSVKSIATALRTSATPILTSLTLSVIAATLTVALAYCLSVLIAGGASWRRRVLDYLSFVPFAFPATVVGIGLIWFWNRSWSDLIYQTAAILIIAYLARFVSFSVQTLNAGRKQISPGLFDAALLSQPSWLKRIFKIDFPLSLQGLAAGWVVAFILCMGELGATLLVIPPGRGTLALKIYTLMHYGANSIVAVLALVLVGVNLILAGSVLLIAYRMGSLPSHMSLN
jgi:iron(III) transport system permease protein